MCKCTLWCYTGNVLSNVWKRLQLWSTDCIAVNSDLSFDNYGGIEYGDAIVVIGYGFTDWFNY